MSKLAPLKASRDTDAKGMGGYRLDNAQWSLLAWIPDGYDDAQAKRTADEIVRAVNARDILVEALEKMIAAFKAPHYGDREAQLDHVFAAIPAAEAALKLAKES